MGKLAVIALGGNAISRNNQVGTIEEQEENVRETLKNILFLIKAEYNIVLTHGNGPQVGNILMRNDAGEQLYNIEPMPLDICVADSQGGIGYLIERVLRNLLKEEGIQKDIITVVTQVVVDKNDSAFKNSSKRVGKIYSQAEADLLAKQKGWEFRETGKEPGTYRRVVPSPTPISIFNKDSISSMAKNGTIIIAVGGGGIPVYIDEKGMLRGIEAVIDKDMASSLLARNINADEFYILTDVPYIYLNYTKPDEEIAEFLNVADAEKYLNSGQFGEGSMAPKIRAAIDFVKKGGQKSVITEATKLEDKKFGSKITMNYD
ncbi:MAG: carbamate kinase [Saprospiraceae bacterium]|nr:carbamate kinase [Saprospiraceae bacterium]